ncbi:unnamed protein product [Rotaria sp. Silwood1]|nr:unnamed protein product [Rotaria sp. Silwood1]
MPPTATLKPRAIVLSGPSGSGKSTLIAELFKEYPTAFAFSISHTTRSPRPGEQDGREYHFIPRANMEKMIALGEFLETTEFSSNLYGTSKKSVEDVAQTGRICLLDVDKQDTTRSPRPGEQDGREYHFIPRANMEKMIALGEFLETTEFSSNLYGTSKKSVEDVAQTGRICLLDVDKQGVKNIRNTDLNALFIYISPPSYEILEQRLRGRKTESEAAIEKRLREAKESMEFSKEPGMYDHIVMNDQLDAAYQTLKEILRKDIEAVLEQQKVNNADK